MSVGIDELKETCQRLVKILEDPQPGLFTWHMAVHDLMGRVKTLVDEAFEKGVKESGEDEGVFSEPERW